MLKLIVSVFDAEKNSQSFLNEIIYIIDIKYE